MDFRDGFCIRCAPGEAGEFIGKIVRGDPIKDFQVSLNFEMPDRKTPYFHLCTYF